MAIKNAKSISEVATTVKQGMAYTNLFKITMPSVGSGDLSTLLEFRAKGSQVPSSELGVMEVPYRGRKLKVPSQRSFSEWTVTVMETAGMEMRATFEQWMNFLDGSSTGIRDPSKLTDITVAVQKGDQSDAIAFTLYGAFPSAVGQIDLSFDEQTAPMEYQVTFQYSYHEMTTGQAGTASSTSQTGSTRVITPQTGSTRVT